MTQLNFDCKLLVWILAILFSGSQSKRSSHSQAKSILSI